MSVMIASQGSQIKPTPHALVKLMLAQLNPPAGAQIRLAVFEDAATYFFLNKRKDLSFEYHHMIIRACSRELCRLGYNVEIKTICLNEYYDFLDAEKTTDTPANLAKFISV